MEATLVVITLLSLALAAGMAIVTWRVLQEARQRAGARVASLEEGLMASLGGVAPDLDLRDTSDLDTGIDPAPAPARGLLTLGIGGGVILALIFAIWADVRLTAPGIGASADQRGAAAAQGPAPPPAAAAAAAPLELVALEQSRASDGLTVHGVVRNPPGGAMIDRLAVVVAFYDANGQQLASVRAPLDFRTLAPGDESPFQVTTDLPTGVTRYRVSFRRDENTIVPHVDRRQQEAS